MATFQKRVSKDGKTSYRVMVRLKGHPPQSATFERITDAKRWAEQTQTAIKEGRYFKSTEARKHTLADLIDRYVNDVLPTKPKSEKKQGYQLRWWKEQLGPYSLAEMRPALIAEHRDKLAGETTHRGEKRGPATVNRYLAALSHAFTIAEKEWEWIDSNPCRKVRRLTEPRGRVRYLTEDETKRLLKSAEQSDDPRLYPLVVLGLSTGARQGELMSLTWSDIDWERSVAMLQDTKNNERRAVPITGRAREVLEELNQVRRIDTDLLFASQKNRAVFPRRAWEQALDDAKIEDFHFHDLRHTAASYLAMSGATLAEIAEVLGHKTLAMVKRYAHLTEQHTSKVVARMNEQIFG